MGPIDQKPPSLPPKPESANAQKSKPYTLEILPTAIQQIISSFLPPKQAFTASVTSSIVHKMLQNNSIWQTVARNLNITLENPKNARSELENLFRDVNNRIMQYLPANECKKLVAIENPFEQNKAIEKLLKDQDQKKFDVSGIFQLFCFDLCKNKPSLDRTDLEVVKMFINNGALNTPFDNDIRVLINHLAGLHFEGGYTYFSHPPVINLVLNKLKENKYDIGKFSSIVISLFRLAPQMPEALSKKMKETLEAFLVRGAIATCSPNVFYSLLSCSNDQWPVIELFIKYVDKEKMKDMLQGNPPNWDSCAVMKRSVAIKELLFEQILLQLRKEILEEDGAISAEKNITSYQEAIKLINEVTLARFALGKEKFIEFLTQYLPVNPELIKKITNANWDLDMYVKEIQASYARIVERFSKETGQMGG